MAKCHLSLTWISFKVNTFYDKTKDDYIGGQRHTPCHRKKQSISTFETDSSMYSVDLPAKWKWVHWHLIHSIHSCGYWLLKDLAHPHIVVKV